MYCLINKSINFIILIRWLDLLLLCLTNSFIYLSVLCISHLRSTLFSTPVLILHCTYHDVLFRLLRTTLSTAVLILHCTYHDVLFRVLRTTLSTSVLILRCTYHDVLFRLLRTTLSTPACTKTCSTTCVRRTVVRWSYLKPRERRAGRFILILLPRI